MKKKGSFECCKFFNYTLGLDYALLEKVRAEITSKELIEEQEMEKAVTQDPKEKKEEEPEEHIQVN